MSFVMPSCRLGLLCALWAHSGATVGSGYLTESVLFPSGEAPQQGPVIARWTSGLKEFFGTALEEYDANNIYSAKSPTAPLSKVWFTGAEGIITEVYWPTIDRPQVKDSQFLATDGKTFFFEEKKHAIKTIKWIEKGVPAFITTSSDKDRKFKIEKIIFTDPDRDVLIQKIKITRNVEGLQFFYLHNPSVANSPMGDSATVSLDSSVSPNLPAGLYAHQNSEHQALLSSLPLAQASAGFEAVNDGYQDLVSDLRMDSHFRNATNGNVAMTAKIGIPPTVGVTDFVIALGFADSSVKAAQLARESINTADQSLIVYVSQWKKYHSRILSLDRQAGDDGELFRASVAMVKSMEDKSFEGAFVASPSIPWGQHRDTFDYTSDKGEVGGYHLVWPRDLYQMASTFLAINDVASAKASLQYFKRTQFGSGSGVWKFGDRIIPKNGSFTQNSWVDGTPYWSSLQMDQTAYPILLTYRLWKKGAIRLQDYWDMVSRAADFASAYGPWTGQERWEENFGASPSTIASLITSLWTAAEMAKEFGDNARVQKYQKTADSWNSKPGDNIESWTFTFTGAVGNGKYFTRIEAAQSPTQSWNPNDEGLIQIANGGPLLREKDVLDGGFLELVRFGIRSAWDFHILETLHEYDSTLKVNTSSGPGFYRYTEDRYNYDNSSGKQTKGMLWPFLSGERGLYEMVKVKEAGGSDAAADSAMLPYLSAMENFATPSLMLPEQVWDHGEFQGKATGAATPLGWTHGEYIKLLRARLDKANPDAFDFIVKRSREQIEN